MNAGHSLTKGYRNYAAVSKVAVLDTISPYQTDSPRNESESGTEVNYMEDNTHHTKAGNINLVRIGNIQRNALHAIYVEKTTSGIIVLRKMRKMRGERASNGECKNSLTDSKGQVMVTKLPYKREEMSVILPIKLSGESINA